MHRRAVEVAIVGAGTAGLTAYGAVSRHTDSVVLIEEGPEGTTCARVGCMPSKLLIAAGECAHKVRHSTLFGVDAGDFAIDGRRVMERVRLERDGFVDSVLASMERIPADRRLRGRARFVAPQTLAVGEHTQLEAQRIILATGARPTVPEFLRNAGDRLLVSDTVFDLETLPRSLAVFGPGVLGIELGQALSRLGVDVRMFGVDGSLASIGDEEIRRYACACFNEEFYLDLNADVSGVAGSAEGVTVSYRHCDKGNISERFDYVLAATGRAPNIETLALENSGLALDEKGMPPLDPLTLQCGDRPVYLVGDVNNESPFLHEASAEGKIAGVNAVNFPTVVSSRRQLPFSIVFTSPQVMFAGLRPHRLFEQRRQDYATGRVSFEDQGRSRVIGENRGILKVYGERSSGLFAGAEMFGPAAEHVGHLLVWALENRMTVSRMLEMPYYHPVIEEGIRTALKDLNEQLGQPPLQRDQCLDCGPGG